MNLFHSARLKLTGFYFAILVLFCLLLTVSVRVFTNHELSRGDSARIGAAHRIFELYGEQMPSDDTSPPPSDQDFAVTQHRQTNVTKEHLDRDFTLLDLALLAIGACLSYWYAGRTLKPIEAAHEQQRRFTSDASHELRTPLATMKLENEIFLRQKKFTDTEARELINSNLEEVDRLEKLATNLLDLNRYEQDAITHEPIAVLTIVDEAIERAQRSKQAAGVTFQKDIVAAQVDVNRESIVELLTILFDNAVKYGPKNGTIELTGHLEDEHYNIAVRDHGSGIDTADLPHIFDRMYRADTARSNKTPGHGIGLSLARQIATANEAELTASNHPEGGAVFMLTLS